MPSTRARKAPPSTAALKPGGTTTLSGLGQCRRHRAVRGLLRRRPLWAASGCSPLRSSGAAGPRGGLLRRHLYSRPTSPSTSSSLHGLLRGGHPLRASPRPRPPASLLGPWFSELAFDRSRVLDVSVILSHLPQIVRDRYFSHGAQALCAGVGPCSSVVWGRLGRPPLALAAPWLRRRQPLSLWTFSLSPCLMWIGFFRWVVCPPLVCELCLASLDVPFQGSSKLGHI